MQDTLQTISTGIVGGGAVAFANTIDPPVHGDTKDLVSLIIQLAIGVVTLIGLLKKKTPNQNL